MLFDEGFTTTPPGSPDGQDPNVGAENAEDQEEFDREDDYEQDDDQEDFDAYSDNEDDEEPSDDEDQDEDNSNKNDLILGKFKSQDDLANAYLNLHREFTKSRQQGQQQPPTPQGQQSATNGQADPSQAFWQHFQQDPLSTIQYLINNAVQSQTAPIIEQRQTDTLRQNIAAVAKEYGQINSEDGVKQLFAKVGEIAQELGNPDLAKSPSQRILRMAAAEAFGETKQQLYNKAKSEGRQAAEAARQRKRGLEAPKGTNPKAKEQPLSEEDTIRQSILAAGRGGGFF